MPLAHLSCPHCTGILQVDTAMSGQPVACPTCQGVIVVPAFSPDGLYADPSAAFPPGYSPPPPPPHPHPQQMPVQQMPVQQMPPPPGNEPMPLGCPHCGGMFQVLPSMAGQQVSCPHCQGVIAVPGFGGSPPGMVPPDFPPPGMAPPGMAPPGMAPPEFPPPGMAPPGMAPPGMAPPSPQPQPPQDGGPPSPASTPASSRPKVVAKPVEGPVKPTDQRTKTVGRGREKIELRRLTPTELATRRRTRNLIMSAVFILLLGAIFIVLLNME